VNSRRLAERLAGALNELAGEELVLAHHGSIAREQRLRIEDDLKSGRLRCVVATSSLELGIDMGSVDLVVQVGAPPSVASGLQRVGRAGHQVGEISTGVVFPTHQADLIHAAVAADRMVRGEIESLRVPANPLDVLAQQTVAAAALDTLDVETWFDVVRRSAPFAALPRSAYDATSLISGRSVAIWLWQIMHVLTLGIPATGPRSTVSWQSVHIACFAMWVLCGNASGCCAAGWRLKKSRAADATVRCAGV